MFGLAIAGRPEDRENFGLLLRYFITISIRAPSAEPLVLIRGFPGSWLVLKRETVWRIIKEPVLRIIKETVWRKKDSVQGKKRDSLKG